MALPKFGQPTNTRTLSGRGSSKYLCSLLLRRRARDLDASAEPRTTELRRVDQDSALEHKLILQRD